MNYWLMKTEPTTYSIDDLKNEKKTIWDGIRNYEARNNLKKMKKGDMIFIYHSSTKIPGVVGLAMITKEGIIDPTQFDEKSKYYDKKSKREDPRWITTEVKFKEKYNEIVSLSDLRKIKQLKEFRLLQKGCRLSVLPMKKKEAKAIINFIGAR